MNKKKKNYSSLLFRIGMVILMAVALYMAIDFLLDQSEPLTHSEEIPPADGFIYNGEPVIQLISRWHQEDGLNKNAINRQLTGKYEVLVLGEDINATGSPDYVVINRDDRLPGLLNYLSNVGFTHVFRELAVYETIGNTLIPILTIDREAIRDGKGNQLIDQVPAQFGYAMLLESYENDELYKQTVQLIELVMIDREGREMSDEIVIYWDTSESKFKATNTFGAP